MSKFFLLFILFTILLMGTTAPRSLPNSIIKNVQRGNDGKIFPGRYPENKSSEESRNLEGVKISVDKYFLAPLPELGMYFEEGSKGLHITFRLVCHKPGGCRQASIRDIAIRYPHTMYFYGSDFTMDKTYAQMIPGSQVDFPETIAEGEVAFASAVFIILILPSTTYEIIYANYYDRMQVAEVDDLYAAGSEAGTDR